MWKALRWMGIGIGLLLLLAAGIWGLSRALGPTDAQERAVNLMSQNATSPGRNAFPAVWLLPYDVPEDQLEAVAAEDMKLWVSRPLPYLENSGDDAADVATVASEPVSVAEGRFGRVVPMDREGPEYCSSGTIDCLAQVRSNLQVYQEWRKSDAKLLDRLQVLARYDFIRNELPPRLDAPFPVLQHFGALPTLRALDFVEGRTDDALAGVCSDTDMMRRFASGSDLLIYTMVSVAYDRVESRLLAEMLEELPADHDMPAECATLASPRKSETLSLCNAMRGEFVFSSGMGAQMKVSARNPLERAQMALGYNDAKTRAEIAEGYAWHCGSEARQMLRQDKPAKAPMQAPLGVKGYFRCADNAMGCVLTRIAAPAYADYSSRMQDMGARSQLLATLLWLREHADDRRPLSERIASRPANLKSPARAIRVADGGKALEIHMYDASHENDFVLPLPAYLQDAPVIR